MAFCARSIAAASSGGAPLGRTDDHRLRTGALGRRTGARQRFDDAHRAGELQAARLSHFTHDENLLASILIHGDADLRILQVPLGQAVAYVVLDRLQTEPTGLQAAEQRKGERAVRPHDVLAGKLRLVDDRDRQNVVRADDVLACGSWAAQNDATCRTARDSAKNAPQPLPARAAEMCCPQHDRPHIFRWHERNSRR